MGWVKLDDRFPDHPKVVDLSDRAFRAHVTLLCYCAEHETDGIVKTTVAHRAAGIKGTRELVDAGVWHEVEAGYEIHDFLAYNPSRAETQERRRSKSVAGAMGAVKRYASQTLSIRNGGAMTAEMPPTPAPTPEPKTLDAGKRRRSSKQVRRDELAVALCRAVGGDPEQTTDSMWATLGTALAQIEAVSPEVAPTEIRKRAALYRERHAEWELTAPSLAKYWGDLSPNVRAVEPCGIDGCTTDVAGWSAQARAEHAEEKHGRAA